MKDDQEKDLSYTLLMIQKELQSFVILMDSKDHIVRSTACNLIVKIDEMGLIPLIDAAKIFMKMLNDSNY
jgi:hypothetical protein